MGTKIKPLLPSLREKKRYLSFNIISDKNIPFHQASFAIKASYNGLYGLIGTADAGMIILKKDYDTKKNNGIIRISNKNVDRLRFSIAMIKEIDKNKVIIKSNIVSGMLKKARESIKKKG